jgi:hypothetical protein
MSVHYRKTSDNVGFEVFDVKTRRVLNVELIFSKAEAVELVKKINVYRRVGKKKR